MTSEPGAALPQPPDADLPSADMEALVAHLLRRHSVGPRHLVEPAPSEAELVLAVRAALRAPDHHRLVPYRFILIPAERRDELAALFEQSARRAGQPDDKAREEAQRARNGPTLVALAARIDAAHPQVPEREQWICVGAALSNFVNALHLMGYGAKVLSGRKAADPQIGRALCEEGETLVGWIVIGTPRTMPRPREENDDPSRVLRRWA